MKQQTTVNHIIVNKEDIKTLVNRSRHCSPTSFLPIFFSFFGLKDLCSLSFIFITLLPSFLNSSLLPQVVGCCVDLHGQWNDFTQPVCVCPSLLTSRKHSSLNMLLNPTSLLHSDLNIGSIFVLFGVINQQCVCSKRHQNRSDCRPLFCAASVC